MRQHYGIAQEEQQQPTPPGAADSSRRTDALLEDLEQIGRLEEVGIRLQRWAQQRGVPMEYALALREYLDQQQEEEERKRRTGKGAGQ
jgi:hypothetical protein